MRHQTRIENAPMVTARGAGSPDCSPGAADDSPDVDPLHSRNPSDHRQSVEGDYAAKRAAVPGRASTRAHGGARVLGLAWRESVRHVGPDLRRVLSAAR